MAGTMNKDFGGYLCASQDVRIAAPPTGSTVDAVSARFEPESKKTQYQAEINEGWAISLMI